MRTPSLNWRLGFGTQIGADSQRLYWATGALSTALLPHLFQVPFWVALLTVAAILWRIAIEVTARRRPNRWLRIAIALAATAAIATKFRTLNGLEAGTAVLTAMTGIKLLESRGARDCAILIFIGYVLLFAALLYDQSLTRLPYIVASVCLLTAALLRLQQRSRPMRARFALQSTAKILAQSLPIAVLLFLFFPRLAGQFWALPSRSAGSGGLSDEMTPGNIAELSLSSDPAFRVKFFGPVPSTFSRYWRGPVLHEFDGRSWRRSSIRAYRQQETTGIGEAVSYRITMEPTQQFWIFALDVPTTWPSDQATRMFDMQLVSRRPLSTIASFELQSHPRYQLEVRLPPSTRALDLALPGDANPKTRAFAQALRAKSHSDADYINAVLNKFRSEEFYYTLRPPLLGDNSLDEFLFATRRGFCEHYASAFTALMRAAGIPARVVTGYQGGEYNSIGDYLLVRQSDAHAWSEAWLEGQGWIRIDPTSAVAPGRVEKNLDAAIASNESLPGRFLRQNLFFSRVRLSWDAVNNFWNDRIVQYNELKQRSLMASLGIRNYDWQTLGIAITASLVLFFVGLSLYMKWAYRPRRYDPVADVYDKLCRKLARAQFPREDHEGPNDYLGRVAAAKPEIAKELEIVKSIYTELRYGPSAKPEDLQKLKQLVRRLAA